MNKDRKGTKTGWKTKRRSEKRKDKRSKGGTQNLGQKNAIARQRRR